MVVGGLAEQDDIGLFQIIGDAGDRVDVNPRRAKQDKGAAAQPLNTVDHVSPRLQVVILF